MRFVTASAVVLTSPVTKVSVARVPAPAPIAVKKGERCIAAAANRGAKRR